MHPTARPSLHHPACGCPGTLGHPAADAAAAAASAAACVSDSLVSNYCQLSRLGAAQVHRPLRVAYMIPHHHVTGGMKVICQHIKLLRQRGHHVLAVFRTVSDSPAPATQPASAGQGSDTGTAGMAPAGQWRGAMPAWSDVVADEQLALGPHQHLGSAYAGAWSLDAVVCGMFQQVPELMYGLPGPVAIIYYEQGHEYLFGDPERLAGGPAAVAQDRVFHMVMNLPVVLATVSRHALSVLDVQFGRRQALIVPNGIDTAREFRPREPQDTAAAAAVAASTAAAATVLAAAVAAKIPHALPPPDSPETSGLIRGGSGSRLVEMNAWQNVGLPQPTHILGCAQAPGGTPSVLLVGDPGLKLKGFSVAFEVLQQVVASLQSRLTAPESEPAHSQPGGGCGDAAASQPAPGPVPAPGPTQTSGCDAAAPQPPVSGLGPAQLPLLVTWVCQQMPGQDLLDMVAAAGDGLLVLAVYIQPAQDLLPVLYRGHRTLLFTSHYEAWGMPVLEAMACGLAVVTTLCGGVSDFCRPGHDCLAAEPGDVESLAAHLTSVLLDDKLCVRLGSAARSSAVGHNLTRVADSLEELLYSSVAAGKDLMKLRQHPLVAAATQTACMAAIEASTMALMDGSSMCV